MAHASAQIQMLQQQNQGLTEQLNGANLRVAVVTSLANAQALPEYRDLLVTQVSGQTTFSQEQGFRVGEVALAEHVTGLRSQMPALFAAEHQAQGTGVTGSGAGSDAGAGSGIVVQVGDTDAYLSNLGGIASGEVAVSE